MGEIILKLFKLKQVDSYSFLMLMLIENVEKPKLPKLVWALRKQFGPETLVSNLVEIAEQKRVKIKVCG